MSIEKGWSIFNSQINAFCFRNSSKSRQNKTLRNRQTDSQTDRDRDRESKTWQVFHSGSKQNINNN